MRVHFRRQSLFLALACASAVACQEPTVYFPPRLAAVLRSPRSWCDSASLASIWMTQLTDSRGARLSDEQVNLGVVKWGDWDAQVTCTEFEGLFLVHVDVRGDSQAAPEKKLPPEIHCRVLDSNDRPLGFALIEPATTFAIYEPIGVPPGSPLTCVFTREGRDLTKARVIVTTEHREYEFSYRSAPRSDGGASQERSRTIQGIRVQTAFPFGSP